MDEKKTQFYFLITAVALAGVLSFFIIRPFLYTIILAVIFAVVFWPIQKKMLTISGNRRAIASFLTIIIVIVFILIPITFLGVQIFKESQQLYIYLSRGGLNNALETLNTFTDRIQANLPHVQSISYDVNEYLRQGLELVLNNLGGIFQSVLRIVGNLLVFLFVLYYALKDGHKIYDKVVAISPLSDRDDRAIFAKLVAAINSVIRGNLTIAAIQGCLTAVGFWMFGVPQPILWGTVAAIAALVPSFGTSLVVVPAVAFLFFTGSTYASLGLLIWGMVAVGLIDNFLGPRLVSMGLKLHPLLVFLAVLGGLAFFGPIGFLLGPLTLSLVFALVDVHSSLFKRRVG